MTQEKIDRINILARKAKAEGLTEEERAEQALLRQEYIDSIKASLTGQLDHTSIMDSSGNITQLKRRNN